jgi:voltage-gated potassium channel
VFALIHRAFHEPETTLFRRVDTVVWVLISVSIALFAVDVVLSDALTPEGGRDWIAQTGWLPAAELLEYVLRWVDLVILALFALELTLRVVSYVPPGTGFYDRTPSEEGWAQLKGRLLYLVQPLNLVDLLTVIAVYPALRGLRALRLLRLARAWRMFRYANPITDVLQAFYVNRLLYRAAFSFLGVLTTLGGISIYLVERRANEHINHLGDGLWWALVTVTTVGFGDISPVTGLGRIIGAALMVSGMLTLAIFAGVVGNTLLSAVLRIRQEQFRMSNNVDHVVVFGYDAGSRLLLDALIDEVDREGAIVCMAPTVRPADLPDQVEWVNGWPTKESQLDKVRLAHAAGVIVVGPRSMPQAQADAETLLILFTIRSYLKSNPVKRKRRLYVVGEVLDRENVQHAVTAGADEVIESARLGFSLLAHAVFAHGTASVMSRVVQSGAHNLYVGHLPEGVEPGVTFGFLFAKLRAEGEAMLIGVRYPEDGRDAINPPDNLVLDQTMRLIYLATEEVLPPD